MRFLRLITLTIGVAAMVLGAVQFAYADAPCVSTITRDRQGTVWWTMCSSMTCTPPQQGSCMTFNLGGGGSNIIYCRCSDSPMPQVCIPAMNTTTWTPTCIPNCVSPADCPDGGWSPMPDGSAFWVCPGCT